MNNNVFFKRRVKSYAALLLSVILLSCGGGSSGSGDSGTPPVTSSGSFTIYTIGDSTMATYDNAVYTIGTLTERRGWCQMFPQFITNSNITFVNKGVPGRSSRDYYNDTNNYWTNIKAALKAGDYVFIQFAHNDEVYNGLSTEEQAAAGLSTSSENSSSYGRGNEAWGTYHEYLIKYIDEARALGATPILIGPVVRLGSFPLSATNCHNLTGNGTVPGPYTTQTSADYVGAMKDVATLKNCPYIDLTAATKAFVESYNATDSNGITDAKNFIYNDADNTHLKAMGATMFAQLAIKEIQSKGLFTSDLNYSGIVLNQTAADFGSIYINSTSDKTFALNALGLTPDTGTITIIAPDQFAVCATANGTFASSIQIPYTGGTLTAIKFYVRFQPTSAGTFSGNVSVVPQSGTTATIAVTGTSITISTAKAITAYSITSPNVTGIINETAKTITVLLPNGTSLNPLVANFTLSSKATAKVNATAQVSGTTPNDFTSSVVYTITAEDLSTVDYTVTATLAVPGSGTTWYFSDSGWPAGTEADGVYNGVTSAGCSTLTSGSSTRTGTLAGTAKTFTMRWQIPKNGSTTAGYLAIPVVGPCTVYVAGLSSGSSAARNIVINDGTTPQTYLLPANTSSTAPIDCAYTYTGGPGVVYVYCTDLSGACSLYGLATRY
jgi:lysophospholipase L1-like esterase